jgi:hypothetical protein
LIIKLWTLVLNGELLKIQRNVTVEVCRPGDGYIFDVGLWLVVLGHNKLVERRRVVLV